MSDITQKEFDSIFEDIVDAITGNIEGKTDGFAARFTYCEKGVYSEDEDAYVIFIDRDPISLINVKLLIDHLSQVTYKMISRFLLTHFTYINDRGHSQYWLEGRINKQRITIFISDTPALPPGLRTGDHPEWPDYGLILRAAPEISKSRPNEAQADQIEGRD